MTAENLIGLEKLHELSLALSTETDKDALLERILNGAKELTNANAGTLYLVNEKDELIIVTLKNDDLGLYWGGTKGEAVNLPPVPLYDEEGYRNYTNVVSFAVLEEKTFRKLRMRFGQLKMVYSKFIQFM